MKVVMQVLNPLTHDARVHKEASTLAGAGYDVRVLALGKGDVSEFESTNGYRIQRVSLKSLRHQGGGWAPALKYAEWVRRIASVTGADPADVYHCHDANTLLSGYRPATRDKARWIYDSHELESGRNFSDSHLAAAYRRLWAVPEKLFIRRVDGVISASESYARLLVEQYAISPPQVIVNAPPYSPPVASDRLRDELKIPADHRILLYQGAVASGRGLEVVIRSLLVLPTGIDVVVLGDGDARQRLLQLVDDLSLTRRVHMPGFMPLDQLSSYTSSADVGLSLIQNTCPSYYYSLPNKVLEYPMAGLPVIASDFPEMRRLVTTYDIGDLVSDPSSPDEVAAAVLRLFSDPTRHASLRANTRRLASEMNWQTEAEKLLAFYERLGLAP